MVDAVEMFEVKRLASIRHLGYLGYLRHLRQGKQVGDKVKFRHLPQEGEVEFVGDLKSLMLWVDLYTLPFEISKYLGPFFSQSQIFLILACLVWGISGI